MGSPCAADARLTAGVACVGDGWNLRAFWWVGPEGDEREVALPRVPWRHRSPLRSRPVWVEWRWGGGFAASVIRTGQEKWVGYPSGFDADQEGLDTTDEDDAIAWLLAHPPTLWVERCAEAVAACATPRSALPEIGSWTRWTEPILWGKHRFYREFIADPDMVAVMVEGRPGRPWSAWCFDPFEEEDGEPIVYTGDSFEDAKAAADAAWLAQAPQPGDGAAPLPDAWCAPDGARPATAGELAVLRG